MIFNIVRTALIALRRDRASLALSFILPIAFFSIFAVIFGGQHDSTPKINVIVVDEDQSQRIARPGAGLATRELAGDQHAARIEKQDRAQLPEYTAATRGGRGEGGGRAGGADYSARLWRSIRLRLGPERRRTAIQLLNDASDTIAPQMVMGLLQKAAMTAMPAAMAEEGMKYTDEYMGGLTPEQRKLMDANLDALRKLEDKRDAEGGSAVGSGLNGGGIIAGEFARRGGREQAQSHGVVLCGGDRRDVSAVHGERLGGIAAG